MAVSKGCNPQHLLWLSMFDGPLMIWANWTIVDTIHQKYNKFVVGVKIQATVDSKLNDSPVTSVTNWPVHKNNAKQKCLFP